jgi:hypothetical protein
MSHYPIIIIPDRLKKLKSAMPKVPKFKEPQPRSPHTPQPIEIKLIILETLGILGVSIGLGLINSLVGIGFLILGLGAIAIQSFILKSNYPNRLQKYEQKLKDYPNQLEAYNSLKTEHDLEVKRILSPENITEFRQRQLLDILKKTKPHDGTNSKARRGMSEAKFAKHLKRYFEDNIHERLTLIIPNFSKPYSPDFAYIDRGLNLYIDIEIDEPYSSSKPIHYRGKDDRRNQFFISRGWIVIRFCEEQVVRYPRQCCKAIAEVITDILGDNLELTKFASTPTLPKIKHWTNGEAILMIKNQARDRYLKSL